MAKKVKRPRRSRFWGFLKIQIVLMILILGALAFYFFGGYASKINQMRLEARDFVEHSTEDTFRSSQTSIAYDVNGKTLSILKGDKDVYYVENEDIPIYMKEAIVSIEDKKFYDHHGIDYKAIVRAVWAMIRNQRITQGASTITQQLARNIYLTQDKTWERKIEEMYIASDLEKKYSKADILEFYLNNIYFANGYYGIQAASKGYFDKEVGELSLSEMAFLCAIPNNPSNYDPLTNYDNTIERRNRILTNMLEDGVIAKATYDEATGETIEINQPESEKHDYAETYTFYCATRALMEDEGFKFQTVFNSDEEKQEYQEEYDEVYSECNKRLYTGGYRIYTSLDLDIQQDLQLTINDHLEEFDEKNDDGIYEFQGAACCIENDTGMVKAIVGGRGQDIKGYTLNRAFQSFRQPGSAIKPLLDYAPALENGYDPETTVVDQYLENGPANADGEYEGEMSLRSAVEKSKNTVAWQVLDDITPEVGISYLEEMQFSHLDENDKRLPASIGGFTYGVSALEMAKGYATLENDGIYREPTCILKMTDAQNNVIYRSDHTETIIYEEKAAREMTDILQGVITDGTGRGLGLDNMPCAGKTGTTNENKDGWFCGYTPYYTTAVWVGYDTPRSVDELRGATYPGGIWQEFMDILHRDLEPRDFVGPAGSVDYTSDDEEEYVEEEVEEEEKEVEEEEEEEEEDEIDEIRDAVEEQQTEDTSTEETNNNSDEQEETPSEDTQQEETPSEETEETQDATEVPEETDEETEAVE